MYTEKVQMVQATVTEQMSSRDSVDSRGVAGMMPANREYDFSERIPTPHEYRQHDGEFDRIVADIQHSARLPRFLVGGPTGCGKSLLASYLASQIEWYRASDGTDTRVYWPWELEKEGLDEGDTCPETGAEITSQMGCPLVTIQCKYSMSEADLLGSPNFNGDQTYWQDGPATQALLASQEMPVVSLIDEANRGRPESKSALMSMLDHRCELVLDGRGGELVQGVPKNLISIATINEGRGYYVEEMDKAERRRHGIKINTDYLGISAPQKEIDLLVERTPAYEDLAEILVEAANSVREGLAAESSSSVKAGIPTGSLLGWANTAFAYEHTDVDNPLYQAGLDTIVRPFYDGEPGEQEVRQTIRTHVDGVPVEQAEFEQMKAAENDDSGASPDNDSVDIDSGLADEAEIKAALQSGADPQDLVEQGADVDTVMSAMADTST